MPTTKILIVDDHRVVIEGIKSALREHPEFEVVGVALNGHQALEQVSSSGPDIVIMDISMPELDGIETTSQVKKLAPEVRIIIFTMHANRGYIVDLFKAGISGYVLKEDPISDLILAVHAVKRGGTYFSTKAPTILLRHIEELEGGKRKETELGSLSERELEVFKLLADGKSIKEIPDHLCISPKTVESHKYNIMEKLSVRTITDLTKIAIRKNLIQLL